MTLKHYSHLFGNNPQFILKSREEIRQKTEHVVGKSWRNTLVLTAVQTYVNLIII